MARRSSSSRPPRSRLAGVLLFLLGFVAGAGSLYFGCRDPREPGEPPAAARSTASTGASRHASPHRKTPRTATAPSPTVTAAAAAPALSPPVSPAAPESAPTPPRSGGEGPVAGVRIALVIDDLGRSVEDVETLGRLGIPVTYAVLPFESETKAVVAALHRRGAEVICHLPMQPVNGQNPGPGALLYGMDREALERATAAALAAVPG
ncbi:MAG TPA: divergent polysaccharide deacetylase family protein, partial [Thermoanaerobaculia bacterium]|nr:divergent polysaccharide deacetylase family protein [Thermoanaerobaculia bacterium]